MLLNRIRMIPILFQNYYYSLTVQVRDVPFFLKKKGLENIKKVNDL